MAELLAPAGSYESLRAAVNAGADAVYIGGRLFGARAYAENPDEEGLIRGIEYCHLHGKKLYLTVNTLLKEREMEQLLYSYLRPLYENGVDAVIVQDLGAAQFIREYFPDLEIHASTQMTVTSPYGAEFLKDQGVSRVVPARELSFEEIREIIGRTGIEVETFIHGAMYYCYSGQCLFSSMLGGRSGNRGRCAQPCRLPYTFSDGNVPGTDSVRKGTGAEAALHKGGANTGKKRAEAYARKPEKMQTEYFLSMKDMCTLDLLPQLLDAGIASLKIEGRMKRPEYTAGVVHIYRKYIDLYEESGADGFFVEEEDRRILMDLYNRGGFSQGYYQTHGGRDMMSMIRPNHQGTEAARIKSVSRGRAEAVALEPLHRRDVLELFPGRDVTLGEDVKQGNRFSFSCGDVRLRPRSAVYRTKNQLLLEKLSREYVETERKEKIKGDLRISLDLPAILRLEWGDISVAASKDAAQPARNSSTDRETVCRQMRKTGNTPFEFETLSLTMDDGLFVPVGQLNELRRSALELLREAILERGRRGKTSGAETAVSETKDEPEDRAETSVSETNDIPGSGMRINVSETDRIQPGKRESAGGGRESSCRMNVLVTMPEQLDAVLSFDGAPIDTVYLDSFLFGLPEKLKDDEEKIMEMISAVREKGCRCFLNCPPVLRSLDRRLLEHETMGKAMAALDGFLLHTVDQLAFFRRFLEEQGMKAVLAADDNLYAYNCRALSYLASQGIGRFTFPAELNCRELEGLMRCGQEEQNCRRQEAGASHGELEADGRALSGISPADGELEVYGYHPLMQSAQCLVKNTAKCTRTSGISYLKDRKGAQFPVLNRCGVCCNTIYNSVPLQLGDCRKEIRALEPSFVRLSFTVETKQETSRILKTYGRLLFTENGGGKEKLEGTRGHFRRGVE